MWLQSHPMCLSIKSDINKQILKILAQIENEAGKTFSPEKIVRKHQAVSVTE